MASQIGYLAGLPRSGSTLLGTLLSQRPDVFVSATSNLIDTMGAAAAAWENSPQVRAGDAKLEAAYPILRSIAETHYRSFRGTVLDKNRGWPAPPIMATLTKAFGKKPKIVATVRPIAECVASFVKITNYKGDIQPFIDNSPLIAHLLNSYHTMRAGYEAEPSNFLFVEYKDLVANPQKECDRVAKFLGLPKFKHKLVDLKNPVPENDAEAWNVPNLHFVRPTVKRAKYSARTILGKDAFKFFQGGEFWSGKADPVRKKQILDLQVEAGLIGDFKKGWEYCKYAQPNDNRALFNKGWYLLRQGKLKEGLALLEKGRPIRIFGSHAVSPLPVWSGQPLNGEPIILYCDGGLGDSICNARFARDIAARGGKVILACDPSLFTTLSKITGVSAVIDKAVIGNVFHRYWVPGMGAAHALSYEYKDLDGSPYIPCPQMPANLPLRVGIRWAGNPKFEHEQHRRFDPKPMFALEGVDLISLQDVTDVQVPAHILQPDLSTWDNTAAEIAKCDLIISSCTSVAHLAGAMGKPTWIIVPILSYYLWAVPGEKAAWYKSVRLFRQEKYGDWSAPFAKIKTELAKLCLKKSNENLDLRLAG